MTRADQGTFSLELSLIVALLVLTATFTLFSLGDAIACAYAKQTVAIGGEVSPERAERCGLVVDQGNRLTVLWDTQAGAYPPPGPDTYGLALADTGEVVAATAWRNITGPEDLYPQASVFADTWGTLTPEQEAAVLAGIYILDFGQVLNGDYLITCLGSPLMTDIPVVVRDIPEGTVRGEAAYYFNGYQVDELVGYEMSIPFSAWQ